MGRARDLTHVGVRPAQGPPSPGPGLLTLPADLVIGVVTTSNANFSKRSVTDQLKQEKITFKTADTLTDEERQADCLVRSAGQALTTGKQAECYAFVTPKSKAFASPTPEEKATANAEAVGV